jgi:DNA-binding transcriptional LysR family regulator
LFEEKTIRLLPQLLSGRIDLALVRPPEVQDKRLEFLFLFNETPVVVFPERHATRPPLGAEKSRPSSKALRPAVFNKTAIMTGE